MARSAATIRLMSEQEDISRSEKLGDEASSGQPASSNAPSEEPGDPAPAVAEQSVLEPFAAVAEARPRGGLVNLMARISPDPRAVHDAWVDLRSMIEEIVRREIQALETRIEAKVDGVKAKIDLVKAQIGGVKAQIDGLEAKVESLRAEFVMMRWMLGILSAAVIGLLGVIVAMFIFLPATGWTLDLKSTQSSRRERQHCPHPAEWWLTNQPLAQAKRSSERISSRLGRPATRTR